MIYFVKNNTASPGQIMSYQFISNAGELDQGIGQGLWAGRCVYLDYRKAFDSVPHQRLLEKLKGLGITGKLLQWLENFLTDKIAGWTKRSSLIHTDGPEWSSARKRIRPTTVLDVCK